LLHRILREKRLLGTNRYIRAGVPCICFSEAPRESLEYGLINSRGRGRYSQYGLQFEKAWIYRFGGRPVIYQSDEEFNLLPEAYRWRHVRLELGGEKEVDFTWEREWRLPKGELRFTERDITVVLPNEEARQQFIRDAEEEDFSDAWRWSVVVGDLAWCYRNGNPWRSVTLTEDKSPTT
jgi:hypothetical protein